jgi:DNA repair protein RadC
MKVIPFKKLNLIRTPHPKKLRVSYPPAAEKTPNLVTVRLKEIVPVYQEVTIRCPVGQYLADAPAIHSGEEVFGLFAFMEYEAKEHFFALHLSAKNEILCMDQVSVGSLTASIVHPREVFKTARLSSAASVLFVHNHPSGDPTPSPEDIEIHERLRQAGELLGIRVLDGIIIGSHGRYTSMARVSTTASGEDSTESSLFI